MLPMRIIIMVANRDSVPTNDTKKITIRNK